MNAILNKTTAAAETTERDPRWADVLARNPKADGSFFYSVKTTGVYCRPSCAARLARPENVRFHASCADAESAGFRPCKRCKPDQPADRAICGHRYRSLYHYRGLPKTRPRWKLAAKSASAPTTSTAYSSTSPA